MTNVEPVVENEEIEPIELTEEETAAHKKHKRVTFSYKVLAVLAAITIMVFGYDVWTTYQNHGQGNTIISLGNTIVNLEKQSLTSQTNHHKQSLAQQQEIIQGEKVVEQGEALLAKYSLEIMDAQADGHTVLNQIATLQKQQQTELNVLNTLGPVDVYLATLAKDFILDVNDLCTGTGDCVPIQIPS